MYNIDISLRASPCDNRQYTLSVSDESMRFKTHHDITDENYGKYDREFGLIVRTGLGSKYDICTDDSHILSPQCLFDSLG